MPYQPNLNHCTLRQLMEIKLKNNLCFTSFSLLHVTSSFSLSTLPLYPLSWLTINCLPHLPTLPLFPSLHLLLHLSLPLPHFSYLFLHLLLCFSSPSLSQLSTFLSLWICQLHLFFSAFLCTSQLSVHHRSLPTLLHLPSYPSPLSLPFSACFTTLFS